MLQASLLQVLRESLTNITKHAQASAVQVEVIGSRSFVKMRVQDNGKGIGDLASREANHTPLGTASIYTLATLLRGTCTIKTLYPGTLVEFLVPIEAEE